MNQKPIQNLTPTSPPQSVDTEGLRPVDALAVSGDAAIVEKDMQGSVPLGQDAAVKPINLFEAVTSGQFDAQMDDASDALEGNSLKRVLLPQVEQPKLHKVLAQAGMGSRLEMEALIVQGRITVNNEPAHIGQRVQYGDQVKVNGRPIKFRIAPPPVRVIAYHKPVGEVVTHDDPQNRPTVFRRLPKLHHGKWQSVGRLDLNTEGLLLFCSSGELANHLMHPRFGLEREYAVRVLGALSNVEKDRLLSGVMLDDGIAQFSSIEDGGGEGANCWYRVTISEGRNREVRRMFEAVGHAVSRLIRIRYGAMQLPRGLRRGAWLELSEHDIEALKQASGAYRDEMPSRAQRPARGAGLSAGRTQPTNGRSQMSPEGFKPRRVRSPYGRPIGGRNNLPVDLSKTVSSEGFENPPTHSSPVRAPSSWDRSTGRTDGAFGKPRYAGQGGSAAFDKAGTNPSGKGRGRSPNPLRGKGASAQNQRSQPDPMRTSVGYIGADSMKKSRMGGQQRKPRSR